MKILKCPTSYSNNFVFWITLPKTVLPLLSVWKLTGLGVHLNTQ